MRRQCDKSNKICYHILIFLNVKLNSYVHNRVIFMNFLIRYCVNSWAKPDPFCRVESGQVGRQDKKTGPIGSGWPQIGFKFGSNPIMYLINPN